VSTHLPLFVGTSGERITATAISVWRYAVAVATTGKIPASTDFSSRANIRPNDPPFGTGGAYHD